MIMVSFLKHLVESLEIEEKTCLDFLYLYYLFFFFFFFNLGFFLKPFTNHDTAGEGGGHFFNSSVLLPPA